MVKPHAHAGFTRVDLLVIISLIAVVGGLFFQGTRAKAASFAPATVCGENMRQLSLAWFLYANDHSGRLVNNFIIPWVEDSIYSKRYLNWANDLMDWTAGPLNTNSQLSSSSRLFPYLNGDMDVFRCPSDTYVSPVQAKAQWTHRARSYSMNGFLGSPFRSPSQYTSAGISDWCPNRRQFLSVATLVRPSETFVFMEEHPDSINDGSCIINCDGTSWMDLPASFHGGACTFGFADGHVELHPWQNTRTKRPVQFNMFQPFTVPSSERDDCQWVSQRLGAAPSALAIHRTASNEIQIAWSQLPTRSEMQTADQLSSSTWTNSQIAPEKSLGQNAIRVPLETGQRFFRLKQ